MSYIPEKPGQDFRQTSGRLLSTLSSLYAHITSPSDKLVRLVLLWSPSTDLDEGGAVVSNVDGADDRGPLQLQHGRHLPLAGITAPPLFAELKLY